MLGSEKPILTGRPTAGVGDVSEEKFSRRNGSQKYVSYVERRPGYAPRLSLAYLPFGGPSHTF